MRPRHVALGSHGLLSNGAQPRRIREQASPDDRFLIDRSWIYERDRHDPPRFMNSKLTACRKAGAIIIGLRSKFSCSLNRWFGCAKEALIGSRATYARAVLILFLSTTSSIPAVNETSIPNEILEVPMAVRGQPMLRLPGIPAVLSAGTMFASRDLITRMEKSGLVTSNCAHICQLYLARDVRKVAANTNQPWFARVTSKSEALLQRQAIVIWADPRSFVKARSELHSRSANHSQPKTARRQVAPLANPPSQPPPGNPPQKPRDKPEPLETDECELEGELCLSSDGTASFSVECEGVTVSVNTKGTFSLQVKGEKGTAATLVIGGDSR